MYPGWTIDYVASLSPYQQEVMLRGDNETEDTITFANQDEMIQWQRTHGMQKSK